MTKITKTGWMGLGLWAALMTGSAMAAPRTNDFPTETRVEYVFACMSDVPSNFIYLQKCSCALDTIAAHMTYEQFVEAQTYRSMLQSHNRNANIYASPDVSKASLDRFYHAEAVAELKCF